MSSIKDLGVSDIWQFCCAWTFLDLLISHYAESNEDRLRHTNPVTEITSSYLGPLMRIFRILCTLTRVIFNVGVWSDPYLSFWVLCFLILLLLVLIVFPWRLFFFAVGIICFGPQVRLHCHLVGCLFLLPDTRHHRTFWLVEG